MKKIVILFIALIIVSGCGKKKEEKFQGVAGTYFISQIADLSEEESKKYQEEEFFSFTEDLKWEHQYNTCEGFILYYGTYRYFNLNEEKMLELKIDGYKDSNGEEEKLDNKVMYFMYDSESITFKEAKFDIEKEEILKKATTSGCMAYGNTTWRKNASLVKNSSF